jgi:hypothetical protein
LPILSAIAMPLAPFYSACPFLITFNRFSGILRLRFHNASWLEGLGKAAGLFAADPRAKRTEMSKNWSKVKKGIWRGRAVV